MSVSVDDFPCVTVGVVLLPPASYCLHSLLPTFLAVTLSVSITLTTLSWGTFTMDLVCSVDAALPVDLFLGLRWKAFVCEWLIGTRESVPGSFDPWAVFLGAIVVLVPVLYRASSLSTISFSTGSIGPHMRALLSPVDENVPRSPVDEHTRVCTSLPTRSSAPFGNDDAGVPCTLSTSMSLSESQPRSHLYKSGSPTDGRDILDSMLVSVDVASNISRSSDLAFLRAGNVRHADLLPFFKRINNETEKTDR
ncbi:hypothetical protein B0H19DRAFT_1276345 [Mycena capillaripes]|nr:hypothetical protein B0H19DRAFT_1276345 [Mycena capillaripes]